MKRSMLTFLMILGTFFVFSCSAPFIQKDKTYFSTMQDKTFYLDYVSYVVLEETGVNYRNAAYSEINQKAILENLDVKKIKLALEKGFGIEINIDQYLSSAKQMETEKSWGFPLSAGWKNTEWHKNQLFLFVRIMNTGYRKANMFLSVRLVTDVINKSKVVDIRVGKDNTLVFFQSLYKPSVETEVNQLSDKIVAPELIYSVKALTDGPFVQPPNRTSVHLDGTLFQ